MLLLALVVGACAPSAGRSPAQDQAGVDVQPLPPRPIEHPRGPGDLVLQVGYGGVAQLRDAAFTRIPLLSVYGDGLVVNGGGAGQARSALQPVTVRRLTDEGLQRLLAAAQAAGLLDDPPDYNATASVEGRGMTVSDAASTEVLTALGAVPIVHSAYALGRTEPYHPAEVLRARKRLADFVGKTRNLAGLVGEEGLGLSEPYVPTAFRLRADVGPAPESAEPVHPWPLPTLSLAEAAYCAEVEGAEARTLREALASVGPSDRWAQAGVDYRLSTRPVLPSERACPPEPRPVVEAQPGQLGYLPTPAPRPNRTFIPRSARRGDGFGVQSVGMAADDRTLVVEHLISPCAASIEVFVEAAGAALNLHVQSTKRPGGCNAIHVRAHSLLVLDAPLGERRLSLYGEAVDLRSPEESVRLAGHR